MVRRAPVPAPASPRLPRLLLVALLVLVSLGALRARWTTPVSVDNRTYLEMIVGIARHGLPYTENGPVAQHRGLQARWNTYAKGRLWGALPPVFPYAAAPIYRLGGVRAVVGFNFLLLGALGLLIHRLTRRLGGSSLAGSAAAWLGLTATPLATVAIDASPYPLMLVALTASVDQSVAALQRGGDARREALSAGVAAGLAIGAHPLGSPMVAALLLALLVWPDARFGDAIARWVPSRDALRRGGWAIVGAAAALLPVAALNAHRFGSPNPVSYGPCVWRSCVETGLDQQGIGAMIRWAAPVLVWLCASAACWLLARRSRGGVVAVVALALGAIVPPSLLHDRALAIASLAWAFAVDISGFTLGYSFWRPNDGLGVFLGPFVVRALLQSTPALLLAALVGTALPAHAARREALLVGLACAALLASLALRANLPIAYALGYPFISLRYVSPALPMLTALAVVAAAPLPWRRGHVAFGAAAALALGAWLWRQPDDLDLTRRALLLRVTLVVGAAAFLLVARSRAPAAGRAWAQAATLAVAAAFATSLATTLAVDLRACFKLRDDGQRVIDGVARRLPARFAVVAYPGELDPLLSLRATRDVEYFDLYESTGWQEVLPVIEHWWRARRPVFVLQPVGHPYPSPLPAMTFVPVDAPRGIFEVRPTEASRSAGEERVAPP